MVRKSVQKPKNLPFEIDIEQLMLHSRQLHLTGEICPKVVQPIINKIMTLGLVNNDPIYLWINSAGGYICDGFALVDTIRMSPVPIYTIIRGYACSMAGIVSVSGHKRFITENSYFMAHDVSGGGYDYAAKQKFHVKHMEKLETQIFDHLTKNSILSKTDLEIAKHGELWLNSHQCLEKQVVDGIITFKEKKEENK